MAVRLIKKGGKLEVAKVGGGAKAVRSGLGQRKAETAMYAGGITMGNGPSGASQSTAYLLGADLKDSMLEGILDTSDPKQLQAVYRDIYLSDHIGGAIVDLKATMPWSDFTLAGGDEKKLNVFMDNVERLNMKSLHYEMSVDILVTGAFCGSLLYDGRKGFNDIIPMSAGDLEITPTPLYSEAPLLRYMVPRELKQFCSDTSKEAQRIQKKIPRQMLEAFRKSSKVDLNPESTLYVPRTTLTSIQVGVSAYRRLLPIYLLERVMYRGTISEATRRQRATLHITAGDETEWIPTEEELGTLVGLFQSTEQDPISSVVATRANVQTQEIRSGGDFWKWTDISDQLEAMKLKALSTNESFLTGDASYNNLETALSVFVEDTRSFRQNLTQRVYYERLFPLISQLNEWYVDDRRKARNDNDTNKLFIPEIHWHKQLRPEADSDYLGILDSLTEKGIPVTMRMYAAAGGINLDKMLSEFEDDLKMRKTIKDALSKAGVKGDDEYASLSRTPGVNFFGRDFGEAQEIVGRTRTGKKKYIHNQKRANQQVNEKAAKALANLSDRDVYNAALRRAKQQGLIV